MIIYRQPMQQPIEAMILNLLICFKLIAITRKIDTMDILKIYQIKCYYGMEVD